jgi:hypothetical protein
VTENEISKIIVDAAIEVHRELGGPGLLEDVYEEALDEELKLRGILVERQLPALDIQAPISTRDFRTTVFNPFSASLRLCVTPQPFPPKAPNTFTLKPSSL